MGKGRLIVYNFKEIKIGPVYYVKRARPGQRLRVTTKGIANGKLTRTAWCGKTIDFTYYSITYIDSTGYIELMCQITGEKSRIFVGKR